MWTSIGGWPGSAMGLLIAADDDCCCWRRAIDDGDDEEEAICSPGRVGGMSQKMAGVYTSPVPSCRACKQHQTRTTPLCGPWPASSPLIDHTRSRMPSPRTFPIPSAVLHRQQDTLPRHDYVLLWSCLFLSPCSSGWPCRYPSYPRFVGPTAYIATPT
jgi:hypothetical protein